MHNIRIHNTCLLSKVKAELVMSSFSSVPLPLQVSTSLPPYLLKQRFYHHCSKLIDHVVSSRASSNANAKTTLTYIFEGKEDEDTSINNSGSNNSHNSDYDDKVKQDKTKATNYSKNGYQKSATTSTTDNSASTHEEIQSSYRKLLIVLTLDVLCESFLTIFPAFTGSEILPLFHVNRGEGTDGDGNDAENRQFYSLDTLGTSIWDIWFMCIIRVVILLISVMAFRKWFYSDNFCVFYYFEKKSFESKEATKKKKEKQKPQKTTTRGNKRKLALERAIDNSIEGETPKIETRLNYFIVFGVCMSICLLITKCLSRLINGIMIHPPLVTDTFYWLAVACAALMIGLELKYVFQFLVICKNGIFAIYDQVLLVGIEHENRFSNLNITELDMDMKDILNDSVSTANDMPLTPTSISMSNSSNATCTYNNSKMGDISNPQLYDTLLTPPKQKEGVVQDISTHNKKATTTSISTLSNSSSIISIITSENSFDKSNNIPNSPQSDTDANTDLYSKTTFQSVLFEGQLYTIKHKLTPQSNLFGKYDPISKKYERLNNKKGRRNSLSSSSSKSNASLNDLLKLVKPDLCLVFLAFTFLVLAALCQILIPHYTGKAIDSMIDSTDSTPTSNITGLSKDFEWNIISLISASLLCGVFTGLRGSIFTVIGARVNVRIREMLFGSLLKQEVGFFDTTKTGEITSRLNSDTTKVGDQVSLNVNYFLRNMVQAVGTLIFMFLQSWNLSLVAFISVPVIVIISKYYGMYIRKLSKLTQQKLADANVVAEEAMGTMSNIRYFACENEEMDRYETKLGEYYYLNIKEAWAYGFYAAITTFLPNSVTALVLFYGGKLVIEGNLTSGRLVSFLLYLQSLSDAFNSMGTIFSAFTQAIGAADKVYEYINRKPSITAPEKPFIPEECIGKLEIRNVKFRYPARPNQVILRKMNIVANPGEVIALVGASGGGKSSCISLLEHLYEPEAGEVLLDGVGVEKYDHKWFHRQVSIVGQEPILYARTIKENIVIGLNEDEEIEDDNDNKNVLPKGITEDKRNSSDEENQLLLESSYEGKKQQEQSVKCLPTEEEIQEACRLSNAHDFIMGMPDGYDTEVGERGVQLSGGQKQRIAIARALVRKPKVLLLDEATSALDASSEHLVQQAIDDMIARGGMTVVVVAHRLSTVMNADRILVLQAGAVVESGTHDELVACNGVYSELVRKQLEPLKSTQSDSNLNTRK